MPDITSSPPNNGQTAPDPVDSYRPRNLGSIDYTARLGNQRIGRVARKKQRDLLNDQIINFEEKLVAFLDFQLESCHDLREERNFTSKWKLNNLRGTARVITKPNEDGTLDRSVPDNHADLGITQGWSFQGIITAFASTFRLLFNSAPRPYTIITKGHRKENKEVKLIIQDILDDLLARGNYVQQAGRRFCSKAPQYGTDVIRYEPAHEKRFLRNNQTGDYSEDKARYSPRFTSWKLQHVYFTDYDKPYATDQSGVYWVHPAITVRDLERDEATFEYVFSDSDLDETVDLSNTGALDDPRVLEELLSKLVVTSGKYINLNTLREAELQSTSVNQGNTSSGWDDETQPTGSVSPFAQFSLAEYEGPLPLSAWVADGTFTPELAEYFGISTSFKPNPKNDDDLIEWGLMLNRIPVWRVAYTNPHNVFQNEQSDGLTDKRVVMLSDSPYRIPRSSAYVFKWMDYSNELMGKSITEIGHNLEDMADLLLNAESWIAVKNAHPSWIIDSRMASGTTVDKIKKLLTQTDTVIEMKISGLSVDDVVKPFFLQSDPASPARRANLKAEFEFSTGVSAAAKGSDTASGTDTLGEIKINEAKSSLILTNIILGMAGEQARMFKDIIVDCVHFLGAKGFYEYARLVSGERAVNIEKMLPESDLAHIEDQFEIGHPLIASNDFAIVVTTLERLYQLVGPEFIDPGEFTSMIMQLAGVPLAEDLMVQSNTPLEPDEEHKLIAQGVAVQSHAREDFQGHLAAHSALFQQLQQGVDIPGLSPIEAAALLEYLPLHMDETMRKMQAMQIIQQQMAGGEGGDQPQSVTQAQQPGQNAQGMDRMETDTVPDGSSSNASAQMTRQSGGNLSQ